MAHLFIICGHGAGDPGAIGNGFQEAERVRALAARIKAFGGDNVTIGDTSKNWFASGLIGTLNVPKDTQLLELHMDSATASARGGHVIINSSFSADSFDNALASFISGILPGRSKIIVGRNDLANINRAASKGYSYRLLEVGFITNATDIGIFNSRMDDIAKGILSSFGIGATSSTSVGKGWIKDNAGWWYRNADDSYPKSQWLKLDAWYYFNDNGYAVTGWNLIKNKWYYFDSDCRMKTGWIKLGDTWYYLNDDGVMLEGWQLVNGFWYYLNKENQNPHGAMQTGLFDEGRYTYYCPSGTEHGTPSGSMVMGWRLINGKWYCFNNNKDCQPIGSMFKNHWLGDYYLKDSGAMACNETLLIGGKTYKFDGNGKVVK